MTGWKLVWDPRKGSSHLPLLWFMAIYWIFKIPKCNTVTCNPIKERGNGESQYKIEVRQRIKHCTNITAKVQNWTEYPIFILRSRVQGHNSSQVISLEYHAVWFLEIFYSFIYYISLSCLSSRTQGSIHDSSFMFPAILPSNLPLNPINNCEISSYQNMEFSVIWTGFEYESSWSWATRARLPRNSDKPSMALKKTQNWIFFLTRSESFSPEELYPTRCYFELPWKDPLLSLLQRRTSEQCLERKVLQSIPVYKQICFLVCSFSEKEKVEKIKSSNKHIHI